MRKPLKVYLNKILAGLIIVFTLIDLMDCALPQKQKTERIQNRKVYPIWGRRRIISYQHVLYTQDFEFEPSRDFFIDLDDSIPVTIYYSRMFNIVTKVDGHSLSHKGWVMSSGIEDTVNTGGYFYPVIILIMVSLAFFAPEKAINTIFPGTLILFTLIVLTLAAKYFKWLE